MTTPVSEQARELLPCPFCGCADLTHYPDGSPGYICCNECMATMPYLSMDDPQSVRWNARAALAQRPTPAAHRSDCAIYNEPESPAGPCDCHLADPTVLVPLDLAHQPRSPEAEAFIQEQRRPTLSPRDEAVDELIRASEAALSRLRKTISGNVYEADDLEAALDAIKSPKLNEGVIAEVKELRELLEKAADPPWFIAERPTNSGLLRIEDGRQHGMFPVTGEGHEIRLVVAAINALPRLLTLIEGGGK